MSSKKPVVLLDVDGVLADFAQAALDILFQLTGRRYVPSVITSWEVFDSLDKEQEAKHQVYEILKGKGGCLSIPVYEGAKEGIARLKEIADIVIVTSPFKGSETWVHERELWLEKHFGNIGHVIHARDKRRIHGDFFIDDKPEHVTDWLNYWVRGGRDPKCVAMLWETQRTAQLAEDVLSYRVRDWNEVLKIVKTHTRKSW